MCVASHPDSQSFYRRNCWVIISVAYSWIMKKENRNICMASQTNPRRLKDWWARLTFSESCLRNLNQRGKGRGQKRGPESSAGRDPTERRLPSPKSEMGPEENRQEVMRVTATVYWAPTISTRYQLVTFVLGKPHETLHFFIFKKSVRFIEKLRRFYREFPYTLHPISLIINIWE